MMKVKPVKLGKTERMSFSHIDEVISMPNLIEVQKNSYQWFLDEGLKEVFHDIGTIEDYTGNLALSFVDFRLDKEPKYSIKECKERDVTYAAPLRVTARLLNKETGEVKDQEIFMGDFPLMTDAGTFVINGAERAIVSQLVRSPGVFYGHAKDKVGNDLYSATMNPNRGAWLEYETDAANVFYVRIDKNRKLPVTVLCRALGLSTNEDILNFFGDDERILATLEKDTTKNQEEGLLEVYRKLRPGEPAAVDAAQTLLNNLYFTPKRYDLAKVGRYKPNRKLGVDVHLGDPNASVLTEDDIVQMVHFIAALHADESTIRGTRDGEVLDDPDNFKTKEESKLGVLEDILQPERFPELYGDIFHKVRINYYPPRGDNKEGWDNIDIFGWMGYPMEIKVNFLCRDSILAAPIALDLVLFSDLAMRAGMCGIQTWLSFFCKSPMHDFEHQPEHDLFTQWRMVKQTLRNMIGEKEPDYLA